VGRVCMRGVGWACLAALVWLSEWGGSDPGYCLGQLRPAAEGGQGAFKECMRKEGWHHRARCVRCIRCSTPPGTTEKGASDALDAAPGLAPQRKVRQMHHMQHPAWHHKERRIRCSTHLQHRRKAWHSSLCNSVRPILCQLEEQLL